MSSRLYRFYELLDRPIRNRARIRILIFAAFMFLSYLGPLWRITLVAPQYPTGLKLDIYSYMVRGGHGGHDIQEINQLNHYIGMRKIDQSALVDLDWLPFAFGILILLALRLAALGTVKALVDLSVLTFYSGGFALARFVYRIYLFGHDLDPHAPVHIEPFMPVVFGTKQVANFTVSSYPQAGAAFLAIFVFGLLAVTFWHLLLAVKESRKVPAVPKQITA